MVPLVLLFGANWIGITTLGNIKLSPAINWNSLDFLLGICYSLYMSNTSNISVTVDIRKQLAEQVLNTLEGQKFADWYTTGRFEYYITGEYPETDSRHITRDMMIDEIEKMFFRS